MNKRLALLLAVPVGLAAACSSSSSGLSTTSASSTASPALLGEDCDPIDPGECGFPFPSNVWRAADPRTKTGYHLAFGPTTLPEYSPGKHIDPAPWARKDGFSPGAAMLVYWPDVSLQGLPGLESIDQSLLATSPTILMEYDTGARVAHWDEIDENSFTKDGQRALFVRPAARLKDATRYIVAIRHVQDSAGNQIAPSDAFKALRDGSPSGEVSVGLRRALYGDLLAKLKAGGVDPSDLQIAWDFTTASRESTTDDMVTMRDAALSAVGSAGPKYTITKVTENPDAYIRRRLEGKMTVPLFLTNPAICSQGTPPPGPGCPGSSINRGADGKPAQNGTADFDFMVQIPNSLVNRGQAGPILQNAHGLLGDLHEGDDSYMAEICDRLGYVEIAVNLEGFASDDDGYVTEVIAGDLGQFVHVVDRLHQGFINELLAMRMMIGGMSTDPETVFGGKPTIDATQRFYRGDSQGGISGGVYMALSQDVTRGLLGEPGAPYELLLGRSRDFAPFFLVVRGIYPDPAQLNLGLDLIQQFWDNAEPDGYLPYITDDPLPNTPRHNVLIHDGLSDQQVSPWGAHFEARSIGAHNLAATNRTLYGIPEAASGFTGNGMCEWDFGQPPSPVTNVPPPAAPPDPHDALRQLDEAQDMADQFFRSAEPTVNQTCAGGGPCKAPDHWDTIDLLTPASAIDGGTNPDAGGADGGAPADAGRG